MLDRLSILLKNRSQYLRIISAFAALSLYCFSLAHASALWFSDAQGLHRIDTASGTVAQHLPQQGVDAITLNQKDGSLWALLPGQLVKYDANGNTMVSLDLKTLATNFNAASRLALDPSDDSVWIAGGNNLFHLDANGQTLVGFATPSIVQDIALAQDETLWVLGRNQLLHYSPQSGLLGSANLAGAMQQANFLALDNTNGVLWLGGAKQLFQVVPRFPLVTNLSLTTSEVISALTLIPDTGILWVSGQSSLFGYTKAGTPAGQTSFAAQKLGNPQTLVFDALSQGLWLGHEKGISRFNTSGQYLATISASVKVNAISTTPSGVVPIVTLVAPSNNALTNRPFTPIVLHYDATCFGQPCNYSASVFATYIPTVMLNGQPISGGFQFDPTTDNSVYTPTTRYAEGLNTIVAYVSDSAGRRSKPITSQFVVDTIPPYFLNVSPADGTVYITSPNITLQGSLDDPNAQVYLDNLNGAIVTGPNLAGQNFSYPITLKPGANGFRLTAADPAGNTTVLIVNYVYATLTLSVTSPINGATVDANKVTVTGTFAGASSATITVNGVPATISGNSFTAADIPLQFGTNSLTVLGTSSLGAKASQTILVTSSFPTITISSPVNGATVNSDAVLVTGTVQAPAHSGVSVNGVIAVLDANNNFFANNVPLEPGSNVLTATVTTQSGKSNTNSVTVVSSGPSPFTISADPTQGIFPLTVAFSVAKRTPSTIINYQFKPGGPGNSATNTDPNVLFAFTYTQPGIYQATVTISDSVGNVFTQTLAIQAQDPSQMDQIFQAIWNGMNNALIAGNKVKAMSFLSLGAQLKYGPVFDKLLPSMPTIIASYSPLQRVSISGDIGEYAINRTINGVNRIFLIYFLQGDDGTWLIDAM